MNTQRLNTHIVLSASKEKMIRLTGLPCDKEAQDRPEDAGDKEMPDGKPQKEGDAAPEERQAAHAQDRRLTEPGDQHREPGGGPVSVGRGDNKTERMERASDPALPQQGQESGEQESAGEGQSAGEGGQGWDR